MAVSARRRAQAEQPVGVARFLREVFDELRKVVWPTPQELYRYTLVVVVTVVVFASFVFAVDSGIGALIKKFIYVGTGT